MSVPVTIEQLIGDYLEKARKESAASLAVVLHSTGSESCF